MKRIQKGTVKGISLKLQEEEREKRMDFVPEVSEVDKTIQQGINVDDDVANMLAAIGFKNLEQVTKLKEQRKGKRIERGPRPQKKETEAVAQE